MREDFQLVQNKTSQNEPYQLSKYRYFNLFIYILASLANSIPAQAFSSINSLVEEKFHFSPVIVTLNTLFFPLLHPIMAFPASWILDKYGMRIGCSLGGIVLIAGVWLRSLIEYEQPGWCLFGSILSATGNVFILNSSSILANNWFASKSVPKIISFSVLIHILAIAIGGSLPGFLVSKEADVPQIQQFFRNQAIMVTVPFILLMIFLRHKPPSYPSKAAQMRNHMKKKGFAETIKALIKNVQYMKILLTMMFSYGAMIEFFSILNQCLHILGHPEPGKLTSFTMIFSTISGIISTIILTKSLKTTLQYKKILSLYLIGVTLTFTLQQILYFQVIQSYAIYAIASTCLGFFMVPLPSIFVAYSSEVIFPEAQGSATGYLFAGSQTFGFIIGLIFITILEGKVRWVARLLMLVNTGFFALAFLVNMSNKENLRRTKFEAKQKQDQNHEPINNEETV